ncbi:MAG TPA: methyltransferase domain-containing protein [Thermoflexales bacterium]|nr:methyltransferase domain-containing protein [Thermoflexales bacterium]
MIGQLATLLRRWRYASASPWRNILRAVFRGDRHHCPVCHSDLGAFLPLPALYAREIAKSGFPHGLGDFETLNIEAYSCPVCGASDRDRFMAAYVETVIIPGLPENAQVVDFAPGQGLSAFLRRKLPAANRYVRADKFAAGVDLAVDLCDMPEIRSESTDFWICSHVLEHVDDDARAARELYRILVAGGRGIVLAPVLIADRYAPRATPATTERERWRYYGQGDHVRLYSRQQLIHLLLSAGFIVTPVQASDSLGARAGVFGIQSRATLYVVGRPVAPRL